MGDLASMEELNTRTLANAKTSGFGIEGVTQHFPCPFCAEADSIVVRIIDMADSAELASEPCSNCERSWKVVIAREGGGAAAGGETSFEMVQTGGPDQPAWFDPKMRRVDDGEAG